MPLPSPAELQAMMDAEGYSSSTPDYSGLPSPSALQAMMDAENKPAAPVLGPDVSRSWWDEAKAAVTQIPDQLAAIPSGVVSLYGAIKKGLPQSQLAQMSDEQASALSPLERSKAMFELGTEPSAEDRINALKSVGKLSAGIAGGIGGGTVGTVAGPAGTIIGGGAGFAGSTKAYDKALQYIGVEPPTTLEQDAHDLLYNTVQGGVLGIPGEVIPRGISTVVGPQSAAGAARAVGEGLAPVVDEASLASAIAKNADNPLASLQTSAELTKSPELAVIESKLGSGIDPLERIAAQDNILKQVSEERDAVRELSGSDVKSEVSKFEQAAKDRIDTLYKAVPEDVKVDIYSTKDGIKAALDKYYGPGTTAKIPEDIQNVLDYINKAPEAEGISIREAQNLRSSINNAIGYGADQIKGLPLGLATGIKNELTNLIENSPKGGSELKAANSAYREYAQTFKEGPLRNIDNLSESAVAKKILSSPEAAAQYDAITGGNIGSAIKDQVISDLAKLSDASKVTFLEKNASQLKTLLKDDYPAIKAIGDDIKSKTSVSDLARALNKSKTPLQLSDVIENAINRNSTSTGIWSNIGDAIKNNKSLSGLATGGAAYAALANPYVGIPVVAASLLTKALQSRSASLIGSTLTDAVRSPQSLADTLALAGTRIPTAIERLPSTINQGSVAGLLGIGNADTQKVGSSVSGDPASITSQSDLSTAMKNLPTPAGDVSLDDLPKEKAKRVSYIESLIDSDPIDAATYQIESGRNPNAKNSESSASGAFQLLKGTAAKLGVKDVFDIADNYAGYKKLRAENETALENLGLPANAENLYSLHYLGIPVFRKLALGKTLSDKEQAQVDYLQNKVLPKYLKVYNGLVEV